LPRPQLFEKFVQHEITPRKSLAFRRLLVDGPQEAQELEMAVARDIDRSKQGSGAMRLSSCVMVPARPLIIGSPGWVRSSA